MIKEKGAILKKGHKGIAIALGFPDSYYLGMSNLGFQAVYSLFNEDSRIACERFFVEKSNALPLKTIESQRTLNKFDVIAFSISYELDALNILKALKLSGLKLKRHDRNRLDPLVIVGGPYASINPLPLFPFVDVFCTGDGEELVQVISDVLCRGISKDRMLEILNGLDGFVVPEYYEKEAHAKSPLFVKKENFKPLVSQILTNQTEFANTCLIEIMRGCPNGCRFCWIGYSQLPWKYHSIESILTALDKRGSRSGISSSSQENIADIQKRSTYYRRNIHKLGLIAPSSTDHPHFLELVNALNQHGYKKLSFSSFKFNKLNDDYLQILKNNRIKSITIAPETGPDELRKVINKNITNQEMIKVCSVLAKNGIKNIKLYFLLGIPSETDEDLQAIVDFVDEINANISSYGGMLSLSFNYHVPKPMTPFQYAPMDEPGILKAKAKLVELGLRKMKKVKCSFMKPETAYYQALLSIGDIGISSMLEEMIQYENVKKVLSKYIDAYQQLLCGTDRRSREAVNRVIKSGFVDNYLFHEYQKALQKKFTSPCPAENCARCGICS